MAMAGGMWALFTVCYIYMYCTSQVKMVCEGFGAGGFGIDVEVKPFKASLAR